MIDIEECHLLYNMGSDGILYFIYDSIGNTFYDQYGVRVINILEFLTPNDLFLFKNDPWYCIFPHRDNYRIMCEILTDGEEYFFDMGEDPERLERYENARASGAFTPPGSYLEGL